MIQYKEQNNETKIRKICTTKIFITKRPSSQGEGRGESTRYVFDSSSTIIFLVYYLQYHTAETIFKNVLQKYFSISIGIFHPLRLRNQIIKMLNYESASLIKQM